MHTSNTTEHILNYVPTRLLLRRVQQSLHVILVPLRILAPLHLRRAAELAQRSLWINSFVICGPTSTLSRTPLCDLFPRR